MERTEKWGVWGWGPVGRGRTLGVGTLEEKEGAAGLTLVGFFRNLTTRRRRGETRVPFFLEEPKWEGCCHSCSPGSGHPSADAAA